MEFFWTVAIILLIITSIINFIKKKTKPLTKNDNYYTNPAGQNITRDILLNELNIAEKEYNNNSFYVIKEIMENGINKQYKEIIELINNSGRSPREWFYSVIGNKAGDLLETGRYHAYRGSLNIVGNDLLAIFDKSYDLLLQINARDIDIEFVNEQKETLRSNIKQMG
jgi:hypothetical protein